MAFNLYTPRTMDELYRQMSPLYTFLKSTFFKGPIKCFYNKEIEYDFVKNSASMAPFVSGRIGASEMAREAFQTRLVPTALVAPKRILTVDDVAGVRLPGESLYSAVTPEQRKAQLLAEDIDFLDKAITRREEWMVAQLLFGGVMRVKGEGVDFTVDIDFSNDFTEKVENYGYWDDTSSSVLDLLREMRDTAANTGLTPNVCVVSQKVAPYIYKNTEIQKLLDIRNFNVGAIEPKYVANGAVYMGYLADPGLYLYSYSGFYSDNETENDTGKPGEKGFIPTRKPYIPDGMIMVGSTQMNGRMYYGGVGDMETGIHDTERLFKTWVNGDPSVQMIKCMSRPMPNPIDSDTWAIANVLKSTQETTDTTVDDGVSGADDTGD